MEKLAGEMVRVGTRGSQLARTQTGHVIDQLKHHGFRVEEVIISTRGDQKQTVPIAQIGNDGVFVRELEKALLEERIDMAVHSLKDLPTAMTPGLELACTPPRATPFDVLVSRDGRCFMIYQKAHVLVQQAFGDESSFTPFVRTCRLLRYEATLIHG